MQQLFYIYFQQKFKPQTIFGFWVTKRYNDSWVVLQQLNKERERNNARQLFMFENIDVHHFAPPSFLWREILL